MPHMYFKQQPKFNTPSKVDGVEFLFSAKSRDFTLIATKIENENFLLTLKEKNGKYLLKYDKITRPIKKYIIKAYKAFCKLINQEPIFSNISDKNDIEHKYLVGIEYFCNKHSFDKKLMVEVGFGSGRHLIYQAKKNPDKLLIGIEIHKPSIEQVLNRLIYENITNVLIVDFDARLLISKLPSNSVTDIFVHFPVPWDKKPHRRIISEVFINESIRVLDKDGELYLRTDSDNYFEYSFNEFMKLNKVDLKIYKNRELEVSSKYEDRWKKMNKNIYDVKMKNEIFSEEKIENFDFSFEKDIFVDEIDRKPKVFDGFVIHLEELYEIDEKNKLIKLTMGAFERPEHLYLIVGENTRYFNNPICIKEIYLAHKQLQRLFDE